MADAFFDVFWWLLIAIIGTGAAWWIDSHLKFDSQSRVLALSSRMLVSVMSLVFAAVLVVVLIEVILLAAY